MEQHINQNNENNPNDNQINQNDNNNNHNLDTLNWDASNPSTYLNIANDYFHLKKYKQALTYSLQFLKFYPNHSEAYILKAKCYMKLFQHGKSIVILNKANNLIVSDENNIKKLEILFLKGKCYTSIGNYDAAITAYDKINSINPNEE